MKWRVPLSDVTIDDNEIANLMKLCDEIAQVNEKICDCRSIIEIEDKHEAEELKKKLQMHFKRRYKKRLIGL